MFCCLWSSIFQLPYKKSINLNRLSLILNLNRLLLSFLSICGWRMIMTWHHMFWNFWSYSSSHEMFINLSRLSSYLCKKKQKQRLSGFLKLQSSRHWLMESVICSTSRLHCFLTDIFKYFLSVVEVQKKKKRGKGEFGPFLFKLLYTTLSSGC